MNEPETLVPKGAGLTKIIRLFIVAGILLLLFIFARHFGLQELFQQALAWISGLGLLGYVFFILLYVLATVLFLPGAILTLGAGFVFGVVRGSLLVSLASTVGAVCAFLIGRYLARDWAAGRIAGSPKFQAVDEAVGREGWKVVLLTRLSPVFPFNVLNYAYGLTAVSLKHYLFASWLGMIPGTVMYVYVGSLAGSLATLGTGDQQRSPAEWVLYGLGLLATLAVTVFVTRLAKKAMKTHLPPQGAAQ